MGEAERCPTVQKALADSINLLNEAAPTEQVIKLKSLEAFSSAADGKATKIIIPSEFRRGRQPHIQGSYDRSEARTARKVKACKKVLQTISGLQDFFARKIVICVRLDS